jgi:hypothetical protein
MIKIEIYIKIYAVLLPLHVFGMMIFCCSLSLLVSIVVWYLKCIILLVLPVLLFDKVLTIGMCKCYVRVLLRVGLRWFLDLNCGCFCDGPFYILHVCV